jgi:hypothetical protein
MVLVLFIQSERETEGEDANLTKRLNDFTSLLAGEILSSQSSADQKGEKREECVGSESMVAVVFSRVRVERRRQRRQTCESHEETQRCESCIAAASLHQKKLSSSPNKPRTRREGEVYLSIRNSLSNPNSAGSGVIRGNMEDPGLIFVDHGKGFTSLSTGLITTNPLSRVVTQLHGQVSHELNGLSRLLCSLQSDPMRDRERRGDECQSRETRGRGVCGHGRLREYGRCSLQQSQSGKEATAKADMRISRRDSAM